VNVSAKEQQTGKEQTITITGSSGLSKTDIDRMVSEAERNAASDEERRRKAEAKNQLDALIFQADKFLQENNEKIGAEEKSRLETVIKESRDDLQSDDETRIQNANTNLTNAYQAAGTSVYQQSVQEQTGQASSQPSGSDFAGYDTPDASTNGTANGAVEGEVVEGEVTDSK
jgi:molecular chaperone DnaK